MRDPPPPKVTIFSRHDLELSRINSRSLLLEDMEDGRAASQSFKVVHRGSGELPADYQIAVSSRENLVNVGSTPEGIRRNSSNQTVLSSRGSASSQLTEVSFIANEAATGNSNPYERIEISNSSPHVHAGTLPRKMSSSGGIMMRGMPPISQMEFRRHTSAVDPSDEYARLDIGGRSPLQPPDNQKGSRVTSVSSMAASVPTSHQNRHGWSPSRSESPALPARNSLPFTPTGKTPPSYIEDPPPAYSDVVSPDSSSSPPFSPSATSMISNGAYEGIAPKTTPQDVVAASETSNTEGGEDHQNGLSEGRHPWYQSASDFSLDQQQPTTNQNGGATNRSAGTSRITPYSQVSNSEIDSRIMEETRGGGGAINGKVPRFSLSGNNSGSALPYTEAVDNGASAESLSRVPAAQPS